MKLIRACLRFFLDGFLLKMGEHFSYFLRSQIKSWFSPSSHLQTRKEKRKLGLRRPNALQRTRRLKWLLSSKTDQSKIGIFLNLWQPAGLPLNFLFYFSWKENCFNYSHWERDRKLACQREKKKNRVHLNGVPIFGLKKDKEDIALVGFKKLKLNLNKRELRNIKSWDDC